MTERFSVDKVKEMLGEIVDSCFKRAQELQKAEGYIKLERDFATIPLPGIDVPFHSRYLWAGVLPFRACAFLSAFCINSRADITPVDLSKKIKPEHINPDRLVGKYVPNLVAKAFKTSKEYAQLVYDRTLSPRSDKVLRKWEQGNWALVEHHQKLAYVILVELLAYQISPPVRWIETEDILFNQYHFERLIEIGPFPTLTGRATDHEKNCWCNNMSPHTVVC